MKRKAVIVAFAALGPAAELQRELLARGISPPRLLVGEPGLVEVATHDHAECVISATVGAVGFVPTLRALEAELRRAGKVSRVLGARTPDLQSRGLHVSDATSPRRKTPRRPTPHSARRPNAQLER